MNLSALSVPLLAALFGAAAMAAWVAGSRLAALVAALTERTGLGQAFLGMLLLGGITSLPEVAAVSTSAAIGDAPLAVNNLLGSASLNVLLLAVADAVYGRGALTAVAASPATLMHGILSILLLALVAMVVTIGEVSLFGFGAGSLSLLAATIAALWLASKYQGQHAWKVVGRQERQRTKPGRDSGRSLKWIVWAIVIAAGVIVVAGYTLSVTADQIAAKTGIASGMIGFVLVATATSVPEMSSITAAVRLRRYELAIGDIFGTNIFNISLIALADGIYRGGPVLGSAGPFEATGALLGLLMTGIFIVGLLERKDRTVLRMGYDSTGVIILFGCGLAVLVSLM